MTIKTRFSSVKRVTPQLLSIRSLSKIDLVFGSSSNDFGIRRESAEDDGRRRHILREFNLANRYKRESTEIDNGRDDQYY